MFLQSSGMPLVIMRGVVSGIVHTQAKTAHDSDNADPPLNKVLAFAGWEEDVYFGKGSYFSPLLGLHSFIALRS